MTKSKRWVTGLLGLAMTAGLCLGEDAKAVKYYKLEFVVKEVGNGTKVLNSRTYSTMVATGKDSHGEIRAGSKVSYNVAAGQYQSMDLGVSIDLRALEEIQDRFTFVIVADVSSVAEPASELTRPAVRQQKWSSNVIVPLKKATLLFSSENLDSKTQMQLEVTATPIP